MSIFNRDSKVLPVSLKIMKRLAGSPRPAMVMASVGVGSAIVILDGGVWGVQDPGPMHWNLDRKLCPPGKFWRAGSIADSSHNSDLFVQ
jgi:hypothetical protein